MTIFSEKLYYQNIAEIKEGLSMEDSHAQRIVDWAVEKGYEGFRSGKYVIYGTSTSVLKKAMASLRIPEFINSDKEICFASAQGKITEHSIGEILRSIEFENSVTSRNEGIEENREKMAEALREVSFFIDIKSAEGSKSEEIVAISEKTREVLSGYNVSALLRFSGTTRKEAEAVLGPGMLEFNPYTTDFRLKSEFLGKPMNSYNTYRPAPWRLKHPDIDGEIPIFIGKLLNHLFPISEERERVLDWLHHCLVGRNQTVLVLAGPKGTGKNILFERIMGNLMGLDLTEMVSQAVLDEKFNSQFINRRLVVFDEVNISSQAAVDTVKRLCNDRISAERKGVDAQTIVNYASMAILTNNITSLRIETNDRRYSVPQVTEKDLKTSISEEEIISFIKGLESVDSDEMRDLAAFGHFLLNRKPMYTESHAIKGEYYYHICSLSMPEWFTAMIDYIAETDIDLSTPLPFKDALRVIEREKNPPKLGKRIYERYIGDYRHLGKYPIGKVVEIYDRKKGRTIPALEINPEFYSELKSKRKKQIADSISPKKEDLL